MVFKRDILAKHFLRIDKNFIIQTMHVYSYIYIYIDLFNNLTSN